MIVFFQAEDGIRDLVRSRGLGDVYKRQRRGGRRDPDAGSLRHLLVIGRKLAVAAASVESNLSLIHI